MQARARRAAAAVGLAAVAVAAIGLFYLRPWHAFAPVPSPRRATPPPLLSTVQQMQFLSGSVGWVVTGRPNSSALLHTTDGGRHWQHQLDGVGGVAWTLSFFDSRRGVVAGSDLRRGMVRRTTDGGQHWTAVDMPCAQPPVLAWFVDMEHGWCVSPTTFSTKGAGPFPDRRGVALFRTADGGGHWTEVLATDPTHPASGGLGDDGQKAWIWFRDTHVGWIGQDTSGGSAVIYGTTDGGDTWDRQVLPAPAGGWGSATATLEEGPQMVGGGATLGLVVVPLTDGPQAGQLLGGGQYAYAWRSPNWIGPVMVPVGGTVEVDQARWLVSSGSSLLETTDAGERWRALGQIPPGWRASRLAMADADHGWMILAAATPSGPGPVLASGLARTADGGRHWTLVDLPPS